jgi:pimeloyl-ACP methyl ester carboxylesterase
MQQLQTGFVETNGTKLYYEMMGEGHPLVLIHGGYIDRRMWDDQLAVFAQHYQVIRYDVRGFGKSELPQVPAVRALAVYLHQYQLVPMQRTNAMCGSLSALNQAGKCASTILPITLPISTCL